MSWAQQQEKGSAFWLNLTLALYRLVGRRLLKQIIVPVVIFWYWLFAPSLRRHSQDYLQRVQHYFQDADAPKRSSYQHLLHFGYGFVDKIAGWLGDIPEHSLVLTGHEQLRRYYGKGAIIVTSHFGNIELLRALKSEHSQTINMLVYTRHAQQFNQLIAKLSPHAKVRLISADDLGIDTAIELQSRLDAGEWLMVAADRTPVQSERIEILPFLGQDSAWPQGAWLLANLLKSPVLAVFCYAYQNQHHVSIHLLSQQLSLPRKDRSTHLRHTMLQYIEILEYHIQKSPYQWFNFYPFWQIPTHHNHKEPL